MSGSDCCECCASGHACASKPQRDAFGNKVRGHASAGPAIFVEVPPGARPMRVGEFSAWIASRRVPCRAFLAWSPVQRAKWLEQQIVALGNLEVLAGTPVARLMDTFGANYAAMAGAITRDCLASQTLTVVVPPALERVNRPRALGPMNVPGLLREANRPRRNSFGMRVKSARDLYYPDPGAANDSQGALPTDWQWGTDADGNPIPVTPDGTPIPPPAGSGGWGHAQDFNGQSVPVPLDAGGTLAPGEIGYDANGTPTTVSTVQSGQAMGPDGTYLYPAPPAPSLDPSNDRIAAGTTATGNLIIGTQPGQFAYYPGTHDVVMVSQTNDAGQPVDANGTVLTTDYVRSDGTTVAAAGHTATGGMTTAQEIAIAMGLVNAGLGFARGYLSDQNRADVARANATMSANISKRLAPTGQPIPQNYQPPPAAPPAPAAQTSPAVIVGATALGLGVLVGGAVAIAKFV